ncbi:MAG: response regulator [Sphingobacteriales bacterium]|nr:MAG: response regulator [Sphingobacteriales bacterium]
MRKIFVLEDDHDIREVVKLMLESENYHVVCFESVQDFMNRNIEDDPDLYILDVMLPDGSGLEVYGQLKSGIHLTNTPIIIMSAHASLKEVTSSCSAEEFIEKPFDMDEFLSKVRSYINK